MCRAKQGRSQGGPRVPVTPTPPFFKTVNNIKKTIPVRLEKSNLCHLELTSSLQLFCRLVPFPRTHSSSEKLSLSLKTAGMST